MTFPTSAALPPLDEVTEWLHQQGEPVESLPSGCLQLRAIDVRLEVETERVRAHLDLSPTVSLSRVIDLIFGLSLKLGADVRLVGQGEISRGRLWMLLADEQDRERLAEALKRAEMVGRLDDVSRALWQVVSAIRPGRDDRWDTPSRRIVELKEVGTPDGISVPDAAWHADSPEAGDIIGVPVQGFSHTLAWRWFQEAYPGLAEAEHTLY